MEREKLERERESSTRTHGQGKQHTQEHTLARISVIYATTVGLKASRRTFSTGMSKPARAELISLRASLLSEFPATEHVSSCSMSSQENEDRTTADTDSKVRNRYFSAIAAGIKANREAIKKRPSVDRASSPFQLACAKVKDDETVGMSCLEALSWHSSSDTKKREKHAPGVTQARAASRESGSYAYYLDGLVGDLLRQRIEQKFRMIESKNRREEKHSEKQSSA
jgi:hypothetical protein